MKRVFLVTLLVAMMSAVTALAADWQQIYTDDLDNKIFFDTSSVKVSEIDANRNAVFTATYRIEYSDKGRQALINWYRDYSIMPRGIENLSYVIETISFRKSGDNRDYYVVTRTAHTATGAIISDMQYSNTTPAWQSIPVGSVVDVEYYEAILIVEGKKYDANY
jgi:hypothetical protein